VLNQGRQQATVRDHDNVHFANACMPISTTSRRDFGTHYLAAGHPSKGDVLLYEIGKLDQPPVAVRRVHKPGSQITDLVMLRHQEEAIHLAVLWKGDSPVIETYTVFQGDFIDEPRSTEAVAGSTLFIETPGVARSPSSGDREIYTYGPDGVVRYRYELTLRL
jgi:hypothetical protein